MAMPLAEVEATGEQQESCRGCTLCGERRTLLVVHRRSHDGVSLFAFVGAAIGKEESATVEHLSLIHI